MAFWVHSQPSMQNTLPLNPGNPLRNVTGLARQIALPGEHMPLRFPSFPALERTAVMGFNAPATLTLPAATPVQLNVFRSATYPVWAAQSGKFTYIVDVPMSQTGSSVTAGESITITPFPYRSWVVGDRTAAASYVGMSGTVNSLGINWPLFGADAGNEFVYVPAGTQFYAVVMGDYGATGAVTAKLALDVWSSPEEVRTSIQALTFGTGNQGTAVLIATTSNAWYRVNSLVLTYPSATAAPQVYTVSLVVSTAALTYTASATTAGSFAAVDTGATVFMPLSSPSEFKNSALPWYATRVTAAAMLGTNVSQVLYKGGTILAGRVSPAVTDPYNVTAAYLTNLHPAEKAYLPLETGVYTYAPPSTDLVFFSDYTLNTGNGAAAAPLMRLDNDSLVNCMFITATATAEQLACTITWHMEFRTSSSLFQIGLSAMTLEALHTAQLVLAENGFFFENPEHDKLLTKVIAAAKKYVPTVVGTVNPAAGKLLQSMVGRLSVQPKPGPSKPKTTSAAKSGIMPEKKTVRKTKGKDKKKKNK